MAEQSSTKLTVYFIDFLGSRSLGADWPKLCEAVARQLADLATETRDNDLWGGTYTFGDPAAALQACCAAIDMAKGGFSSNRRGEPLPVQLLLHDDNPDCPLGLDPRMWAFMQPEEIYVTKRAWEGWQQGDLIKTLPLHKVRDDLLTALRLTLADRATVPEVQLFPRRTAPLSDQDGEECFYCGVRGHRPSQCPSRHLRPDVSGLSLLGRMPLSGAEQTYARAFSHRQDASDWWDSEIGPDELRKHPQLQPLCAFYDLRRVYQPRFLVSLFLSGGDSWPDAKILRAAACGQSSSPICQGWRALVVQNYPQAETLFGDIKGADSGTKFFGEVGLAFVAVEKGQPQKVRYHLDRAGKIASTEAERLYLHFLRSRALEVAGDLAGALQIMDDALEHRRACDDSRYQRERLAILVGRTDGCTQRLQMVAARNREAVLALLIDPWMEPIRGDLDRKLLVLLLTAQQGGKGKYVVARAQAGVLANWLGEGDPELAPVRADLRRLEGKVSEASYYDMLELEQTADKLTHSCSNIRRTRSSALRKQIAAVDERWLPLQQFWREFGLKGMYRQLGERFVQTQGALVRAQHLATQEDAKGYGEAVELLKTVNREIRELAFRTREIGAIPLIYSFIRRLLAYLVMMESLSLAVGLTILPLFRLIFSIDRAGHASASGGKTVLYTLTFAVAPVLALVLAARKQQQMVRRMQTTDAGP